MSFYFQAPDLAEFPRRSYRRFLEETLGNLFAEISPIASEFSPRFEVSFVGGDGKCHWKFEDYAVDSGYPTSAESARRTNMTHSRRMLMEVWLRDTQTGELRKSTAYVADVPVITDRGTFVINGSERVVLGQLVRAPGIYYSSPMPLVYKSLMLAEQGAPITFEMELDPFATRNSKAKCRVKLPKRSWIAATTLLTAMGIDLPTLQKRLAPLYEKNRIEWKQISQSEALGVVGRAWKPDGGGGTNAGATALKELTDKRRYSLGHLGRRRINNKLGLEGTSLQLTAEDMLAAVEYILGLPLGNGHKDNIDSLENRHLRGIGEILTRAVRPALAQMSRSIRTRLELNEDEEIGSPNDLLDCRPFANAVSKFFAGNPLVQYLDQQNPLSELSHRRRITSFGPGGIDPNAAPVEMRDVHPSQIGRVCLVESPEGKNCGMVSYMATYCRIDDDGFMTVPYRRVTHGRVTDEVRYLTPADDKLYTLAPPDTKVGEDGYILGPLASARRGESFFQTEPNYIDFIGIAPQGFISVGSGLIPFLEHDDANRALMGGGMMRQTLPLIRPERPRVGTGMEKIVARSSGHSVVARRAGTVTKVTGQEVTITQASGESRSYPLIRYDRTNQNTILDQRPNVKVGQKIDAGQIIADGPAIDNGELALGRNLLIAFLSCWGRNYEDAIVVREGLVRDHKLSHIEIEKHSIGVHQTLRGPEILTPELPNVSGKDLEHLDERGIAKIGSYVNPGDVLVSKLSPKEQRALSAEEELLQAIFGKVAEEMADSSLRVPHGSGGRVIDVRIFTPETTPELKAGVICEIEVLIARLCPLEVGDKLAGRHGNKGIVSIIVPDQDMPYLPDGTPVDLVLNPLGVPSRMNVGQVFDTQLGFYASVLNRYYRIHQFDESISADASYKLVTDALKEVRKTPGYEWLGENGKVTLYDGRTGESFDQPVLVGRQYMLKLNQLVLHKINARSGLGGPYAAVTQQPVGGKANHGGQRMGEMEVWAIQAYGAAHLLNEMMTIKSDDIQGRHQSYAEMVQGKNVSMGGRTAAFDGLCCELRGLGMEVTLGKVVDSFEPVPSKVCARADQPPPKTLEEEYMVSAVDRLEEDGVKILEIPAGDYVPNNRPPVAPLITSVTNGRNGIKPRVEVSEEPLIDDIEDGENSLLDAFIDSETQDILGTGAPGATPTMTPFKPEKLESFLGLDDDDVEGAETNQPTAVLPAIQAVRPPVTGFGPRPQFAFQEFKKGKIESVLGLDDDEFEATEPDTTLQDFAPQTDVNITHQQMEHVPQPDADTHEYSTVLQPEMDNTQYAPVPQPDLNSAQQYSPVAQPDLNSSQQYAPVPQPDLNSAQQYSPIPQPDLDSTQQYAPVSQPDLHSTQQYAPVSQPDLHSAQQYAPVSQPDLDSTQQYAPVSQPDLNSAQQYAPVSQPDLNSAQQYSPIPQPDHQSLVSQHQVNNSPHPPQPDANGSHLYSPVPQPDVNGAHQYGHIAEPELDLRQQHEPVSHQFAVPQPETATYSEWDYVAQPQVSSSQPNLLPGTQPVTQPQQYQPVSAQLYAQPDQPHAQTIDNSLEQHLVFPAYDQSQGWPDPLSYSVESDSHHNNGNNGSGNNGSPNNNGTPPSPIANPATSSACNPSTAQTSDPTASPDINNQSINTHQTTDDPATPQNQTAFTPDRSLNSPDRLVQVDMHNPDNFFTDFPSMTELQSLASQLLSYSQSQQKGVGVGAKLSRKPGENPHTDSNFAIDDEES